MQAHVARRASSSSRTHSNTLQQSAAPDPSSTATHCKAPQHTATHRNTLLHIATHYIVSFCAWPFHEEAHLPHYVDIYPYVSISIRTHTRTHTHTHRRGQSAWGRAEGAGGQEARKMQKRGEEGDEDDEWEFEAVRPRGTLPRLAPVAG